MEETKLNIRNSKSSLFLMELIIVIMFFSLASGSCIQLFAKAHQLTEETTIEQQAMMITDSVIACMKQRPNDLVWVASQFQGELLEDEAKQDKVLISLNNLLKPMEKSSSENLPSNFQLSITKISSETENYKIEITEDKTKDVIYQQEIVCHQAIGK